MTVLKKIPLPDLKKETVRVSDWDGEVVLHELDGYERMEFYRLCAKGGVDDVFSSLEAISYVVSRAVRDDEGKCLLTHEQAMRLHAVLINDLGLRALSLSGMTGAAAEDARKKSGETPDGERGSD